MLICNVWDWFDCECSLEKSRLWREPDGGNLHVRFDEGEESGGHWSLCLSFRAFLSTLLVSFELRAFPGQFNCKGTAFAGHAFDNYLSAVRLDDMFDDAQSDPNTLSLPA
jgi:hypothetical protein